MAGGLAADEGEVQAPYGGGKAGCRGEDQHDGGRGGKGQQHAAAKFEAIRDGQIHPRWAEAKARPLAGVREAERRRAETDELEAR